MTGSCSVLRGGTLRCVEVVGWVGVVVLAGASVSPVPAQEQDWPGCPRDALTQLLESSAAHREVADVAAIEREVLSLCNTRQELINQVVEGEARLQELRGVAMVGSRPAREVVVVAEPEHMPVPEKAAQPTVDIIAPIVVAEPEEPASPAPQAAPLVELTRPASAPLSWTAVYGSAGEWIAGITDGVEVWYVRQGDALPTGERVVSVRVRPPGVAVGHNGQVWQLPGPGV